MIMTDFILRRVLRSAAVSILTLSASLASVTAATLEVGAGKPHATILSAVTAATSGDTIEVFDGDYTDTLQFSKSLTIKAAAGQNPIFRPTQSGNWNIFIPGDYDFVGTSPVVVWEGIDIAWSASNPIGMLFGSHPTGVNVTFRDIEITDNPSFSSFGYGPFTVYQGSTVTLERVTMTLDNGSAINGIIFGTPANDMTNTIQIDSHAFINVIDCQITARTNASRFILGGQETVTKWNVQNSSFTTPGGTGPGLYFVDGGGSRDRSGGAGFIYTEFAFDNCVFEGTPRIQAFGIATNKIVANETIFRTPDATISTKVGSAGAAQEYTNCAFVLGGGNGAILRETTSGSPASQLRLHNCTIAAPTPSAAATIVQNAAGVASTLEIDNNIFLLQGSNEGVVSGEKASVTVTAGTNLRFYGAGTGAGADALTGTIITADPQLDTDNVHLLTTSPAIDAGVTTVFTTIDIDGDARPFAAAYDLGADESAFTAPLAVKNWTAFE